MKKKCCIRFLHNIKTSDNEIVLTGHRNAIRNTNTPIGHDIAFLRNTFGTDIVNNEITSFINLPTMHITNEQQVLLSNLNMEMLLFML